MLPQWEVWTGGAHTEAVLPGKIAVHTSKVQLKLVPSVQSSCTANKHWGGDSAVFKRNRSGGADTHVLQDVL